MNGWILALAIAAVTLLALAVVLVLGLVVMIVLDGLALRRQLAVTGEMQRAHDQKQAARVEVTPEPTEMNGEQR